MAYEIKNSKFYKKYSGTPLGEIKNNKIYKYASGTPLGEVKNNKIYQYARGNPLAEVKNIKEGSIQLGLIMVSQISLNFRC